MDKYSPLYIKFCSTEAITVQQRKMKNRTFTAWYDL